MPLTRCYRATNTHLILFCFSAAAAQIIGLKAFSGSWTQIYPANIKYGLIINAAPWSDLACLCWPSLLVTLNDSLSEEEWILKDKLFETFVGELV